jgi:Protein of unknown function (DUF1488)
MLNFPNPSRSYDGARHCIRFWGNDGAAEVPFFMEEAALLRIAPGTASGEAALLNSFDQHREFIILAARSVYQRRRKGSYELIASAF